MKTIYFFIITITILSIVGLSVGSNTEEVRIGGVWIISREMPEMKRLLKIKQKVDIDSTFCININENSNQAELHFYTLKTKYDVKVIRIDKNIYKMIYKNQESKFIVTPEISKHYGKVAYLGFYDQNGEIAYSHSGVIYCLDEINDFNKEKCGDRKQEVEMCLKSAKDSDDYFKRDEKLPY